MRTRHLFYTCVMIVLVVMTICQGIAAEDAKSLYGRYMGQNPPGDTAVVFAPGIVSTDANEHGCAFSPDGTEFYFTRIIRGRPSIMVMRMVDSVWTEPEVADFSGEYNDRLPSISPDGRTLLFESIRPKPNSGGEAAHGGWQVRRTESSWSEPEPIPAGLRPGFGGLSMAVDRTLYSSGIKKFAFGPEGYGDPEELGAGIDGAYPFIAPDQSYLLYCSGPLRNLAVCFREADGGWGEPQLFTNETDSYRIQGFPVVTPDGKYLFYTINHDIYWVTAEVFLCLKPVD